MWNLKYETRAAIWGAATLGGAPECNAAQARPAMCARGEMWDTQVWNLAWCLPQHRFPAQCVLLDRSYIKLTPHLCFLLRPPGWEAPAPLAPFTAFSPGPPSSLCAVCAGRPKTQPLPPPLPTPLAPRFSTPRHPPSSPVSPLSLSCTTEYLFTSSSPPQPPHPHLAHHRVLAQGALIDHFDLQAGCGGMMHLKGKELIPHRMQALQVGGNRVSRGRQWVQG